MIDMPRRLILCTALAAGLFTAHAGTPPLTDRMDACMDKIIHTLEYVQDSVSGPRNVPSGERRWKLAPVTEWTSGYWPGILWYACGWSSDEKIRLRAERATDTVLSVMDRTGNHDLGIMTVASAGNAYRFTGEEKYRDAIIEAAGYLSRLYNPRVGTINSWPYMKEQKGWPHNTIIDNMINIELLFLASELGGDGNFRKIAHTHALTTMKNHFRKDGSTYHVVVHDDKTGKVLERITHQGYADSSMWARGQAWAIYGFTMSYRYTGDRRLLRTAVRAADAFLSALPEDGIPYWDFDDPDIPDAPKDASAAAIAASALLELSSMLPRGGQRYYDAAEAMLDTLSGPDYFAPASTDAFILHCTGHKPHGYEIDEAIIYGDYYYMEALMRRLDMEFH